MLTAEEWLDLASQDRIFGRRPNCRTTPTMRLLPEPKQPQKRGDLAVRVDKILNGQGILTGFRNVGMIYNGRRWMNRENYDPKKRYN